MGPALRSRTASNTLEQIPVIIVGGGVCGLLAADRCLREGIDFVLFERGEEHGGNWLVRANTYSHLQARRRNPWTAGSLDRSLCLLLIEHGKYQFETQLAA